jgi:hypothetical protein
MKFVLKSGMVLLSAMLCVASQAQFGGRSERFGGGFGGGFGSGPDTPLQKRFDTDKNGYLDKNERKAAYAALSGDEGRSDNVVDQATKPVNASLTPAQVKNFPGKDLYDMTVLRTVFLTFEDKNWEAEMAAFKGTDIEMPATAMVDGQTYRNVGVHFRGNTSFRDVPDGYKRSLKVSFDFLDKKQHILGYKALELMNAAADATYLRSVLYLQMARDYLPAPKANYMRVVINGENWGIYINSQPFNSDFVEQATGSSKGARWKVPGSPNARGGLEYFGDDMDYYQSIFEITSKDKEESWRSLVHLTKVLNQTSPDKLEAALKPLLDVDGVLRFLALDNVMINNDGYWVRASDYSIYQDASGLFHVTPHDVNETLRNVERMGPRFRNGGSAMQASGVQLDPLISANDSTKPLLSKLLAVPAYRQTYLAYVHDIALKWLDWKRIEPLAQQYQALIANDVKQDNRKLYSYQAFVDGVTKDGIEEGFGMNDTPDIGLKGFVQQRRAYLLNWLANNGAGAKHVGT